MSDFAASAMMRLVHMGLKRQRISLESSRHEPVGIDARLPLADKRSALVALQSVHGIDCLLRIGEAVEDISMNGEEAVHTALLLANDPIDLLKRWQRLERFIHSHHRIAFTQIGPRELFVRHYSVDRKAAPLPAEDALVIGLLVLLLERVGAINLRARRVGSRTWLRADGRWRALSRSASAKSLAEWTIQWSGEQQQTRDAITLTDETLIGKKLFLSIMRDPTKTWTLASAAAASLTSSRTIQRRLQNEGTSFQRILRESRVTLA